MSAIRNPTCPRCKSVPKEDGCSYCRSCKREVNAENQRLRRAGKGRGKPIVKPRLIAETCNCGNLRCRGLTCDSLRYGTATHG